MQLQWPTHDREGLPRSRALPVVLVLALACRAAVATGDEDEWPIFAKVRAHSGDGQRGISSHWLETGLLFFFRDVFLLFLTASATRAPA